MKSNQNSIIFCMLKSYDKYGPFYYISWSVSENHDGWEAKSRDPDRAPCSAASDLGLLGWLKPIYPTSREHTYIFLTPLTPTFI